MGVTNEFNYVFVLVFRLVIFAFAGFLLFLPARAMWRAGAILIRNSLNRPVNLKGLLVIGTVANLYALETIIYIALAVILLTMVVFGSDWPDREDLSLGYSVLNALSTPVFAFVAGALIGNSARFRHLYGLAMGLFWVGLLDGEAYILGHAASRFHISANYLYVVDSCAIICSLVGAQFCHIGLVDKIRGQVTGDRF